MTRKHQIRLTLTHEQNVMDTTTKWPSLAYLYNKPINYASTYIANPFMKSKQR